MIGNPNLPHLEALSNRLAQVKLETQVHSTHYMGKLSEFQAASMTGDAAAMEAARIDLHSILDSMLDTTALDGMLNRQVIEGLHDLSHLRGNF